MSHDVVNFKRITLESAGTVVVTEASFSIGSESKVALVGSNGAGKSTLLRFIAGQVEASAGIFSKRRGVLVEYVPQFIPLEIAELSLIESLLKKMRDSRPDLEEWKAYDILTRFDFDEKHFELPLKDLSGGEANRALLAQALVVEPDLLLLDEPTNHMDSESIVMFERLLLEELKIPFCIVSHDRELLDCCTVQTLFVRDQQLYSFGLPYSLAKEALINDDLARAQKRKDEEKEIERLNQSAKRLRGWAAKNSDLAARYQSMQRRINRLEEEKTEITHEKVRNVSLGNSQLTAKTAVLINDFQVTTPEGRCLFNIEKFSMSPGDRIALLGRNGAGKTTLLNTILHFYKNQDRGATASIRFNPQVKVGYYDQELSALNLAATLFDHVQKLSHKPSETVKKELISAGFQYERHREKIATLSGGERARLHLVALKLQEPNLFILDEPTNHIDVQGIERLEDEVLSSDATFLMVSHDRRFITTVANRFFLINRNELIEVSGPEEYYGTSHTELA